jgi:hypothetical protein
MTALMNHALRSLSGMMSVELPRDPLAGRLAGELRPEKRQ